MSVVCEQIMHVVMELILPLRIKVAVTLWLATRYNDLALPISRRER
jgi:hypothetical protein